MDNSTHILACDANEKCNLFNLSNLCTNGTYNETRCIPDLEERIPFRVGMGVWGIIVVLFGVLGNLITLISVPYASKRQR